MRILLLAAGLSCSAAQLAAQLDIPNDVARHAAASDQVVLERPSGTPLEGGLASPGAAASRRPAKLVGVAPAASTAAALDATAVPAAPGNLQQQRREMHTDRAKHFQEEQQRTRADFQAKSRAHAEAIASLRNGHVEAAKVMEAESQVKLDQYKQDHLERQREAEVRRAEPVSASALPATAGALAELTAEVAAMQATMRGLRAELALRFDAPPASGYEGTCSVGGAGCASVTLPLSIRLPSSAAGLSRVVNLPVTVPALGPAGGAGAPRLLRVALGSTVEAAERADASVRLSAVDLGRLYDTLLQMYLERLLPPPGRPAAAAGVADAPPPPAHQQQPPTVAAGEEPR